MSAQTGMAMSPTCDFLLGRELCSLKKRFLQCLTLELTQMRRSCSLFLSSGNLSMMQLSSKIFSRLEESSEQSSGFFFTLFLLRGQFSSMSNSIYQSQLNSYSSGISSSASYMLSFSAYSMWRQQLFVFNLYNEILPVGIKQAKQPKTCKIHCKTLKQQKKLFYKIFTNRMQKKPQLDSSRVEKVRKENQRMKSIIENYLDEIQKQKLINQQRQNQIESLLKFNQRLLNIIETQMVNKNKDNQSLKTISEKSERESDIMNTLNSLIKTKKTFVAKSEKGTKSLIQATNPYATRLETMGKNLQNSEFAQSEDGEDSYRFSAQNKPAYRTRNGESQRKYSEMTNKIQVGISTEMKKIQCQAEKNKLFYEQKANQLKKLSHKIGTFNPQGKFNQITKKIPMSAGTANLLRKAMLSKNS